MAENVLIWILLQKIMSLAIEKLAPACPGSDG
jgi:hypothetical protein